MKKPPGWAAFGSEFSSTFAANTFIFPTICSTSEHTDLTEQEPTDNGLANAKSTLSEVKIR